MKAGFALPNAGQLADGEHILKIAQRAEALGFKSVWVLDRILYPLKPRTPYPVTADGSLPEPYKRVLDPLEVLTFVAAHTLSIRLGTSILDLPFYNPVMLARRLTTLDVLSEGRLTVGFGLGWSEDEFEAAGASFKDRGRRADEFIQVLKAIWTQDPVEFHGKYFQVARSIIEPKPVQKPHPPIIFAAFAPAALRRVAQMADGWNPVALPVEAMKQMIDGLRSMCAEAGRDPDALRVILRANLEFTEEPAAERAIFTGSRRQIRQDIEECRGIGIDEIIMDPTFSSMANTFDDYLSVMDEVREWL